jgi:hypothetical protein
MPPKKRPVREPPAEDPSQMAGGQDHTTIKATILTANIPQTSDPHTSTESHTATIDVRRPEGPTKQPSTQTEVVTTDVATLNPPPSSWQQRQPHNQASHWEEEAQEDYQQDSEDKIEAIIKDELARLR